MKKKLLFLSAIEGAAVMCAELCGARLLAPVFGNSLHVWAAVMGITLAALASGYFFGGRFEVNRQQKALRLLLILASLYLLLMPLISRYLLPVFIDLPFTPGMMISTLMLLLPPIFFLGATSPLLIAIQTKQRADAGKVSGTVYAVSTAGGITSTFLCGFWMIPDLGLDLSLLIHGTLLLAATLFIVRGSKIPALLMAGGIVIATWKPVVRPGLLFAADGIQGKIEVLDVKNGDKTFRRLLLNGIIQSESLMPSGESSLQYTAMLDSLLPEGSGGKAALLGGGGGQMAQILKKKGFRCRVVEFDKRMIYVARTFFAMGEDIEIINADARHFLNTDTSVYDLLVADLFHAEEQPSHIFTLESLRALKKNLSPSARIYLNWHGYINGNKGEGTRLLLNTFSQAGYNTKLYYTGPLPDYRNIIILAMPAEAPPQSSGKVNRDFRPALEKYNAPANKEWRRNYLRYMRES